MPRNVSAAGAIAEAVVGSAETFVLIGAAICVAPVIFGFVVTRWVIGWSDPSRRGPLV